jgi:hypothetical protein
VLTLILFKQRVLDNISQNQISSGFSKGKWL